MNQKEREIESRAGDGGQDLFFLSRDCHGCLICSFTTAARHSHSAAAALAFRHPHLSPPPPLAFGTRLPLLLWHTHRASPAFALFLSHPSSSRFLCSIAAAAATAAAAAALLKNHAAAEVYIRSTRGRERATSFVWISINHRIWSLKTRFSSNKLQGTGETAKMKDKPESSVAHTVSGTSSRGNSRHMQQQQQQKRPET